MTIPIPLEDLAATLPRFGSALLMVSRADDWPKLLTVDPYLDVEAVIVPSVPATILRHVAASPRVTLAWPPPERHGHTLIIDGWAAESDGDVRITVDHAVLHRPSAHADGPAWA